MGRKFKVGDTCWVIHGSILEWVDRARTFVKGPHLRESTILRAARRVGKSGRSSYVYTIQEKKGHVHVGISSRRIIDREEYLAIRLRSQIATDM